MPYVPVNPLCSVADVKSALRLSNNDVTDDGRIGLAVDAASRLIERKTRRRFYQDATPSARLFVPESPWLCPVDDFEDTTGLTIAVDYAGDGTFATTWQPTDYQLEPINQLMGGHPWPYTKIRAVKSLTFPIYGGIAYPMPYTQALVQVTARWGWSAVPSEVQKAAIVQSIALLKADDAPFGATPFAETGVVRLKTDLHPTAAMLIEAYIGSEVLVA